MTQVISIRVPSNWQGRVTSESVRACVVACLRQPVPLTKDPGPGSYKLSIRFTGSQLAALRRISRNSVSSAIRRIAASHSLAEPQTNGAKWLNGIFGIGLVLLSLFGGSIKGVGQRGGQKN
jgi:hypothetical protein